MIFSHHMCSFFSHFHSQLCSFSNVEMVPRTILSMPYALCKPKTLAGFLFLLSASNRNSQPISPSPRDCILSYENANEQTGSMCVQMILVFCPGPFQSLAPILGNLLTQCTVAFNSQCLLLQEPLYPQECRSLHFGVGFKAQLSIVL